MTVKTEAPLTDCVKITTAVAATGYADVTWFDMRDYDNFLAIVIPSMTVDGTNYFSAFKVMSNSASDGTGTDHDIAEAVTASGGTTKTLTSADCPTGGKMALDVRADQMYAGDRYISVSLTDAATTTSVLVFVQYNGNYSYADLLYGGTASRTAFQYDGDL